MKTNSISLGDGSTMSYGGMGSDEFNAGYELREIQDKERNEPVFNEAVNIINMLVGLVYDLYPDEEYVEMYGIEGKIAQAQKFVDSIKEQV